MSSARHTYGQAQENSVQNMPTTRCVVSALTVSFLLSIRDTGVSKPIPQAYQWVPHSSHGSSWGPVQDILLSYEISGSHHGGGAGVGATAPPSVKGLKVNVQTRRAPYWGFSTVTPPRFIFCSSALLHAASLFHPPLSQRFLFSFFNSHLFWRNTYCNAPQKSYPFISFNLSGLFVEEGRDSNTSLHDKGRLEHKDYTGRGRRVRKGI